MESARGVLVNFVANLSDECGDGHKAVLNYRKYYVLHLYNY